MQQKIITYMKQNNMIAEGDRVVVGCSGGADSVCLLLVLHACEKELGFSLSAVHVEHGIRGEESWRDAGFVQELCERLHIPLAVCPVNVPAYAAEHKLGLEEAARLLRFEAFRRQAQGDAPVKVALAHHMEDNAETMLFSLARGSGAAGLCGIAPVRQEDGICYIRPLLCADRGEIEQYLSDRNQPYCTDSTNEDESYSRNRIRKSILPLLTEVNAQAVRHMSRCAESVSGAYNFLRGYAAKSYGEIVAKKEGRFCLHTEELEKLHPAVRQEVLRMLLFEAAGSKKDIAAVHVDELFELTALQSGRRISLPYGLTAFMEYDTLYVCREDGGCTEGGASMEDTFVTPDMLCGGQRQSVSRTEAQWFTLWQDENGGVLRARVWNTSTPLEEITKKAYTKQFDYDMIKDGFVVRNRRPGDYFILNSEGGRKKLSDYMINEKIPARLRGRIPLLARDKEVLWLIGWRIGADCKVTADTTRILEVQYNGGWSDGLCSST